MLIEIANFNYFDPLYHYIEQEYGIDPVSLAKYRKGRGSYVQKEGPYFDPLSSIYKTMKKWIKIRSPCIQKLISRIPERSASGQSS